MDVEVLSDSSATLRLGVSGGGTYVVSEWSERVCVVNNTLAGSVPAGSVG